MRFDVITLMPEMFGLMTRQGVVGRGFETGAARLKLWNPRDYTQDVHRTVDDRPYGGGPGMVMKYPPLKDAVAAAKAESPNARVIYLSPQGRLFDQTLAEACVANGDDLILLAGRYEGVDQRVIDALTDDEWSIGDYVLSGGELAAMVVIDAVVRLIPGVLGDENSAQQDSFTNGLLDCPHYTRPLQADGMEVPQVLRSGDHERIRRWRLKQALAKTRQNRPDLLIGRPMSAEERQLLEALDAASDDVDDD